MTEKPWNCPSCHPGTRKVVLTEQKNSNGRKNKVVSCLCPLSSANSVNQIFFFVLKKYVYMVNAGSNYVQILPVISRLLITCSTCSHFLFPTDPQFCSGIAQLCEVTWIRRVGWSKPRRRYHSLSVFSKLVLAFMLGRRALL